MRDYGKYNTRNKRKEVVATNDNFLLLIIKGKLD